VWVAGIFRRMQHQCSATGKLALMAEGSGSAQERHANAHGAHPATVNLVCQVCG